MLPDFNADGLLPPGTYRMTFAEIRRSFLILGPPACPNWDVNWRAALLNNLERLAEQLWSVRIADIYIDGSFVERKGRPNDIDGYFVCDFHDFASGSLQKALNYAAGEKIWTWSKDKKRAVNVDGQLKHKLPMWINFRVELYPVVVRDGKIQDDFFVKLFRRSKADKPKGIIQLASTKTNNAKRRTRERKS
jgi:hypothetical protein